MTTKHTPGPWKYMGMYSDPIIAPGVVWLDDDGACGDPDCCGDRAYHIEISEEDARLIAAAPETAAERDRLKAVNADLLAALEAICDEDPKAGAGPYMGACRFCFAEVSRDFEAEAHTADCAWAKGKSIIAKAKAKP